MAINTPAFGIRRGEMEKRGVSLKKKTSERFIQQKQARYMFRPTLSGVVFAFAQARASHVGATGLGFGAGSGWPLEQKKGIQVVPVVLRSGSFSSSSVASLFPATDPRSGGEKMACATSCRFAYVAA